MRILTIRGTRSGLEEAGMGRLAVDADLVVELDAQKVQDRWGQVNEHQHIAVDPPELVLFDCIKRIREAWEGTHVKESHLGHAAAGMWLCYWLSPQMEHIEKLVVEGRSDHLRAACFDFIDSGFGLKRGPKLADQNGSSNRIISHR